MRLSIIIPAYNCEDYIKSCIVSVCEQDLYTKDYEVIVINDGSTDNTLNIVNSLAQIYPNIRLQSQTNKGNGSARNKGLSLAKGNYIYFLDADDYILKNKLETIISEAEKNNLDILCFKSKSTKTYNDSSTKIIREKNEEGSLLITDVCEGKSYIGKYGYRPELWWYIIKREFLLSTKLEFYDRKFIQDSYFTPSLFISAKRIRLLNLDVHRYRLSENSITRNKTKSHIRTHIDDMVFALGKLRIIIDELPENIENQPCKNRLETKSVNYTFILMTRFIKSDLNKEAINSYLETLKLLKLYPLKSLKKRGIKKIINPILTTIFNSKTLLITAKNVYNFIQ